MKKLNPLTKLTTPAADPADQPAGAAPSPPAACSELELASFQAVLGQPITEALLDHWIAASRVRNIPWLPDILLSTVWGTIRWRKSIGRPLAPTLASAFVIEHIHWQQTMVIKPDGTAEIIDLMGPHPEPSKWDGPDDEDFYRVSFMAETPQYPTRIRVNFAAHIPWEQLPVTQFTRPGYRDIAPSERQFRKGNKIFVLEPFEVVIASLI